MHVPFGQMQGPFTSEGVAFVRSASGNLSELPGPAHFRLLGWREWAHVCLGLGNFSLKNRHREAGTEIKCVLTANRE